MSVPTILVVDDDPDIRDIVAVTLEEAGFDVNLAANGEAALAIFEDHQPDLVILDVEMPGLTGHDVARRIRQRASTPILFLSSRVSTKDLMMGFELGADDYVAKPFQPPLLIARVMAILRRATPTVLGERRYAHYCPACDRCVEDEATDCPECNESQPDAGWPLIFDSDFRLLGRVLDDRLVLDKFIGAGGMGSVYRAQALDIRRQFACKVVDASQFGTEIADEIMERFAGEIDAMSQLRNPHVVSIYESMRLADDTVALLMDFVPGQTLQNRLVQVGRFSTNEALDISRQVANGMHEAHQLGIVHRDLKPANIMVEPLPASGSFARILDFGIARVIGRASATQGFLGTPMFASPEQCLGDPVDVRSDIYSLGCIMFCCLTGRPPVEGKTAWKVMEAQVHGEVPRILDTLPSARFPKALDELVHRMLQKDPEERPQDMREVIEGIDDVLARWRTTQTMDDIPILPDPDAGVRLTPTVASSVGARLFDLTTDTPIKAATLRRDGARAAVADASGKVLIADVAAGRWVAHLLGGPSDVGVVTLDPMGRRVYVTSDKNHIHQWDLDEVAAPILLNISPSRVIEADKDGLVVADDDGRVGYWRGDDINVLTQAGRVTALAIGPQIAIGTRDGKISIAERSGQTRELLQLDTHATALAMSRDGYLLAILDTGGGIQIVETVGGRAFFALRVEGGRLSRLAFSDDAQLVGMSIAGTRMSIWRLGPQLQAQT